MSECRMMGVTTADSPEGIAERLWRVGQGLALS
jgi:hypothetical protein